MLKQGLRKRLNRIKLGILTSIPEAMSFCNALVIYAKENADAGSGAAMTQRIDQSTTSIWGTMKVISISLLVVVLGVCGIILMIGTQKMKESVKEHFYSIAIGVMILFLAKEIADYCQDTFG